MMHRMQVLRHLYRFGTFSTQSLHPNANFIFQFICPYGC